MGREAEGEGGGEKSAPVSRSLYMHEILGPRSAPAASACVNSPGCVKLNRQFLLKFERFSTFIHLSSLSAAITVFHLRCTRCSLRSFVLSTSKRFDA